LIGAKWHARVAPVLFTIFVFYAGLGSVSPHESLDQLLTWIPMQILLYYIIFSRTAKQSSDVLLLALGVFSVQFLLSYWLPTVQGYGGWMAFAFLLGRFLGIYHPPAQQDEPLSLGRKILGWVSLLIFVLCASPEPLVLG
jgi:FtsH-binding integral membrane protein